MAQKTVIVTGGAGFIGCNTVARLMAEDCHVLVIDNLCRPGSESNLEWLQAQGRFDFEKIDLTDAKATERVINAAGKVQGVVHLAGQVAVTTSLVEPRADFLTNALGTLNVLEAVRLSGHRPVFLYSSTNKVYGGLEWVELEETENRWVCTSHPQGLDETAPLDFHSPYGCSKGAADQYVRDYARCYSIPTFVLRQSCILGPRQFGMEDQGWVAWFLIAAMLGRPVTVYGDGKQVRDLLWVEDLADLYVRLLTSGAASGGEIYNVGGGAAHVLSLIDLLAMIENLAGSPLVYSQTAPRQGDQRWFVADSSKARRDVGWSPSTNPEQAVSKLWAWLHENRAVIEAATSRLPQAGRVGSMTA